MPPTFEQVVVVCSAVLPVPLAGHCRCVLATTVLVRTTATALIPPCSCQRSLSRPLWRRTYSVSAYTFGSPRVGNHQFAAAYNRLVPNTWRVFDPRDQLARVPRLQNMYAHVGNGVAIMPDQK